MEVLETSKSPGISLTDIRVEPREVSTEAVTTTLPREDWNSHQSTPQVEPAPLNLRLDHPSSPLTFPVMAPAMTRAFGGERRPLTQL